MVMSPNFLEVMSFRVTATVVCCILMQILCVVSQKSFSPDPLPGLCLQTPSLLLCPPNNPVRSTPLVSSTGGCSKSTLVESVGGQGSPKGAGHGKNFVSHLYKYAVFDIKPTYNHQISIPGVQLHLPEISFEEGSGDTSDWGTCPLPLYV